jgi:hypothetical protein
VLPGGIGSERLSHGNQLTGGPGRLDELMQVLSG